MANEKWSLSGHPAIGRPIMTAVHQILRLIPRCCAIFEAMNSTMRLLLGPFFVFVLLALSPELYAQKGDKSAQIRKLQESENVFIDATKAEMLEDLNEAFKLYQKSLDLNPNNPAAYFKMADILGKQNRFTEALKFSKKANELEKKNIYYLLQLAQMQEINQEWKSAIETYRKVMKDFPGNNYYLLTIVQLDIKNKNYKEAIKDLEKAEKAFGPSKEYFLLKQKIFLSQDNLPKAILEGQNYKKAFPDEPEPGFSLAQILVGNGKFEEAIKECNELLERFPNFPAAHLLLADIYINQRNDTLADKEMELAFASPDLPINAKIDLVSSYLRGVNSEDEMVRANRLSDLILQTHPDDPRGFLIKGDILNKQMKKREARDMYLKALVVESNNFPVWEQIVLIDLNLNDMDSVIIHTAKAKVLFPNTPSFSFYNGLANLMKKNYPDAVESLEQAKRISLDNPEMQLEIYAQLGDAYHNLKESEKSGKAFDEVLRLDSNNAHVLNNYSYFLSLEKNNLDKALKMSEKLVALFPEDPTYLDTYGWVLYVRKEFAAARPVLEKAAKAANSGVVWEHYGDVLFQLGAVNEAMDAWKKAKELGGELSEFLPKKLKDKKLYE